jgi:hypothetical protein
MSLTGRDREFALAKITYVDFKHIEMDRVLTLLFPRLEYGGYESRRPPRKTELSLDEFVKEFLDHPEWFAGFSQYPDIVRKWVETDLLDVVNRGKPNQAIAAPRPLHGKTYKFRNTRHARDYGAAAQIYWMLYHARRGQAAREALKDFFFQGLDRITGRYDPQVTIDVETQALLRLDQQVLSSMRETKEPERFPPLCTAHATLLADDILRLLAYQQHMPRSVLVDYLKTLLAFHLALYHLRLLKLLPALVRQHGGTPPCALTACPTESQGLSPYGTCPYRIGLVVDMDDPSNPHMAELAWRSADAHYRRIPEYVRAHFVIKKLDEMATYLSRARGKIALPAAGYFAVGDLLQLLDASYSAEREAYFKARLASLIEGTDTSTNSTADPDIQRVNEMGLEDFDTYIELLVASRGRYHRQYITECLDSLCLKNSEAGLLHQSRATRRRFVLGSRLLEVLLQIAVLTPQGTSFATRDIRIEALLRFLQERYGLYIDHLPLDNGFRQPSILDRQALRKNAETFKTRLREIGFYQDLADAYVTQTVTPRYTITAEHTSLPGARGAQQ